MVVNVPEGKDPFWNNIGSHLLTVRYTEKPHLVLEVGDQLTDQCKNYMVTSLLTHLKKLLLVFLKFRNHFGERKEERERIYSM